MQINKETFTIQDLKQLLKEAFDFDYEKHKGEVKFYPFTIVEWHKSDVFKNELSFDNIKGNILEWRRPFDSIGTYFPAQKTFAVFFWRTEIKKLLSLNIYKNNFNELLLNHLFTIFHELQHYYQDVLDEWDEENLFSHQVCGFVQEYNPQDYKDYHDEYWYEIDANLYGIDRVYEFLENKGMLTKEMIERIQMVKNQYLFDLNNFDVHLFLTVVHEILKQNPEIDIADYGFLSLFYDNNHRFSSIDEILLLSDTFELDKEVLNIFFSSKDFLDSLDFNILSLENKQIIMNAIEYALEKEINRRKKNKEFLQNKQITAKQYLDADARICNKIAYFNKKLDALRKTMNLSDVIENEEDLETKRR